MSTFYTYLLYWSSHQRYYYGVRYANNAHPSDLFVTYFTSSKHVKTFISEHGRPDIIQVRKTFSTKDAAREWETRVLNRMDVLHDPRALNKTNNRAFRSESRTPEHQAKLNAALKGRKSPFKGKTHTDEKRAQISASRKGQKTSRVYAPLSEETKKKLSDSKKGKVGNRSYYTEEYKKTNSKRSYESGFNKVTSDTIWINNGFDNKRIKPEQLESYPGFVKGRLVPKRLT